jgi:hypothetical protein
MCQSTNKVCRGCGKYIIKWSECDRFVRHREAIMKPELQPSDYEWIAMHGATTPTKMQHTFVVTACSSCKHLDGNLAVIKKSIISVCSMYAGAMSVMFEGDKEPMMKWMKQKHDAISNETDEETDNEIQTAANNGQLVLARNVSVTDGETETDTEDEGASNANNQLVKI